MRLVLTEKPSVARDLARVIDPEADFTLAVDRPFTNQQGERDTDFIDVVAWKALAENVANHLSKGGLVAVEGRREIRNYESKDGSQREAVEVIVSEVRVLDSANKEGKTPAKEAGRRRA